MPCLKLYLDDKKLVKKQNFLKILVFQICFFLIYFQSILDFYYFRPCWFNAVFISLLCWLLSCVDFILLLPHELFSNSILIRLFPFFGFSNRALLLSHIKYRFFYIPPTRPPNLTPTFILMRFFSLPHHTLSAPAKLGTIIIFYFPVFNFSLSSLPSLSYLLLTLLL